MTVGPDVTAKAVLPVATTFKVSVVECVVEPLEPMTVIG